MTGGTVVYYFLKSMSIKGIFSFKFSPKLFSTFKNGYNKQTLVQDLLAGVIVGIVALPLAIA